MARKKKSKAASKKKRGPEAVEATPSEGDAEPTKATSKKKKRGRKKKKQQQSKQAQETEAAVSSASPAVAEVAEVAEMDVGADSVSADPAVDLDADLDAELDDSEGAEALLAQMAAGAGAADSPDGDAEPAKAPPKKKRGRKKKQQPKQAQETEAAGSAASPAPPSAAAEEAPPVDEEVEPAVELDADLDAELDDADDEDIEALIAQMAAGVGAVDSPDEASQDLDDDLLIEVLDEEPVEPVAVAATHAPAPAPAARAPSPREVATDEREAPVDRGPVSTPEFRERLLAQALAHTEMQDARYRVPFSDARARGRWKGAIASAILLVAAVLLAVPPGWVQPEPPARIDARERVGGVRSALLLQAQQVDAFRVQSQRLPNSLDELPDHFPALRYLRSGNGTYQLVGYGPDGQAIIYDSTNPSPEFDRFAPSWLGASP